MCPYFLARQYLREADVVVMSQQYMLDPRLKAVLSTHLDEGAIVVFDDCTNIENDCINYRSLYLNKQLVDEASHSLLQLDQLVKEQRGSPRLKEEYKNLV